MSPFTSTIIRSNQLKQYAQMWSDLIGVLQFKHYLFTLCKYVKY